MPCNSCNTIEPGTCRGSSTNAECGCMCHPMKRKRGADDEAATPADVNHRFVPEYYQLAPVTSATPDVLDVCAAAGLDVKAYLVIETLHKLFRFEKKGYAVKDLNKSLEQLARLRDIVTTEQHEAVARARKRNI